MGSRLFIITEFVKNVAGLSGEWESPGGRAKRFNDSNLDFVMTWYPGKLNSLIFHGKEGESFKKFLVRILQTNSANQTDAITDGVLNTTTKTPLEPNLLSGDLDETTNNTSTHINSSVYNGYCCESRIDSKVLKVIKSDVVALQTQMKSVICYHEKSTLFYWEQFTILLRAKTMFSECLSLNVWILYLPPILILPSWSLVISINSNQLISATLSN
jgi:hypothetical protein